MNYKITRLFLPLLLLSLCFLIPAHAEEAECVGTSFEASGFSLPKRLYDNDRATYAAAEDGAMLTVSRDDGIGALYVEFDRVPQRWTLTEPASGVSVTCGENGFLHEFVDVVALFGEAPKTLVIQFETGTVVAEVYAFSQGSLPDWVQRWQPPCEEADLMLLSTHSDDEQLFFAGILPYYGVERGLKVQVVYFVQHFQANGRQDHQRPHEQLDGLWTVGIRNYPMISQFPDLYAKSNDRAAALSQALAAFRSAGFDYDDFVGYITECIRRFKPLVVVSHDLDGEYGHGAHVLCATALTEAVEVAADPERYSDSAAAYGVWEVEKTYLHLYEENQIVLELDVPLESLGGKTPFQVTQDGFACHKSQHWTWFYKWIYGTKSAPIKKAADIKRYSPCLYGLYDTKVGPDVRGGDFFENVDSYEQRELAAKAAAEKAKAEEAARAAEKAREEAAARAAEEARAEAARAAAQEAARAARLQTIWTGAGVLIAALGVGAVIWRVSSRRRRPPDER